MYAEQEAEMHKKNIETIKQAQGGAEQEFGRLVNQDDLFNTEARETMFQPNNSTSGRLFNKAMDRAQNGD
jgi:hypothetical protein